MAKKNVVIIGYGTMGEWHAKRVMNSDVVDLVGIYDIDEKRVERAKERGIYAYPSFEAVLADERVDAVVIATPNDLHKPFAIEAMKNGKHVVSEKPATVSSRDLQEMIDSSEKYGKVFTVHQNRRWDTDFLLMKELYRTGELGEVFSVESRVQGSRGLTKGWRHKKEHGGGIVLDWGVHMIDQMLLLVYDKKIKSIYCRFQNIMDYEVEDCFKLDIYFEDDFTARVEVGTSNFISLPRFYMTGTNGSATVDGFEDGMRVVCCKDFSEEDVIPVVTSAGLTKTMAPRNANTIKEIFVEKPEADVHDFYRNLVKVIDGEAELIVTHKEVMRVMRVIEAAFESARIGLPVEFDDSEY